MRCLQVDAPQTTAEDDDPTAATKCEGLREGFSGIAAQSQGRALSRYQTPVISITHLKSSSVLYKNMTSTTEEVTPEIHQKRRT